VGYLRFAGGELNPRGGLERLLLLRKPPSERLDILLPLKKGLILGLYCDWTVLFSILMSENRDRSGLLRRVEIDPLSRVVGISE
jgi:hypothetical protein